MKPVSMPFETGFIALRKYLRWPTQLLASAYGYMVNEKRGIPEEAPPPIKRFGFQPQKRLERLNICMRKSFFSILLPHLPHAY